MIPALSTFNPRQPACHFAAKVTQEPGFQFDTFDKAWEQGAGDHFERLVNTVQKLPNQQVELYLTHRFVEGKDAADSMKLDEVILGRKPRSEHEGPSLIRLVRQVEDTHQQGSWWQSWKMYLTGNGPEEFTKVVLRALTQMSKNLPLDVPNRFIGKPVIVPEFQRLQGLGFMANGLYDYV